MRPGGKNAAEKRKKEIDRQKWQAQKAERRRERQLERQARGDLDPEEDPDIAGIVPGPQPIVSEAPADSTEKPAATEAGQEPASDRPPGDSSSTPHT